MWGIQLKKRGLRTIGNQQQVTRVSHHQLASSVNQQFKSLTIQNSQLHAKERMKSQTSISQTNQVLMQG